MTKRRDVAVTVFFGVFVAVLVASGIGVRATYGAQTTADEPQYLLSALSLWEDGDLDISDELAAEAYRPVHAVDLDPQTYALGADGRQVSPHDPLLPVLLAGPMRVERTGDMLSMRLFTRSENSSFRSLIT